MRNPRSVVCLGATAVACLFFAAPALAEPDNRDVVHDTNGHVVLNTFGHCVRTQWVGDHDECGAAPVAVAPVAVKQVARATISEEARTVYFPFNKALLTAESRSKLDSLASTLKSDDQVKEAHIYGYADRIGSVSYNDKLSKKRAETVRNYLVSRGFVKASVAETRWYGKSRPKADCPNTLARRDMIACLQQDRKVEVEIEYLPSSASSTTVQTR